MNLLHDELPEERSSHGDIAIAIYLSQLMGCMGFSLLSQSLNTYIESRTIHLLRSVKIPMAFPYVFGPHAH